LETILAIRCVGREFSATSAVQRIGNRIARCEHVPAGNGTGEVARAAGGCPEAPMARRCASMSPRRVALFAALRRDELGRERGEKLESSFGNYVDSGMRSISHTTRPRQPNFRISVAVSPERCGVTARLIRLRVGSPTVLKERSM
jgi:hypothetical protein